MALTGNLGGHFHCVNHRFVAEWIAPVLEQAAVERVEQTTYKPGSQAHR